MGSRPTILHRLALVALAAVLLLATGAQAQADENAKTALARLTAEERAYLEANVPDWTNLNADRKEKIARNVLRIRKLSPEERDVFMTRVAELKRHHEARRGPRPHRLHEMRDPRVRRRIEQHGRLLRAMGTLVWAQVPEEGEANVKRVLGRKGPEIVTMLYHRRVFDLVAKKVAAAGVPEIVLDENTPPEMKRRLKQWRKKAEEGDEKAVQRLAYMAVGQEFHAFAKSLEGPMDEAVLRRVGAALKAKHPDVFEKADAEILAIVGDEETLKRYARKDPRGRGREGPPGSALFRLLHALREAAPHLRESPDLQRRAEELRKLLEKHLRSKGNGHPGRDVRRGQNGRPFGPGRPGRRGPGPRPPDRKDPGEDG